MKKKKMYVYSGKCRLCECGLKTNIITQAGVELFTGDIVTAAHDSDYGAHDGLSVVVSDQFETYSIGGGQIHEENRNHTPFIMGFKGSDLKEWIVFRVKSFSDVVDGEHWKDYGFSFMMEEDAK